MVPREGGVVVAFSRGGPAVSVGGAEFPGEVEELEAREHEAQEGAAEDEVEEEVVAFLEAEGVVDFAEGGGEGAGLRGFGHCGHE